MSARRDLPVAFFDSGVGGLSVLREAVKRMPHENCLYFGDSANAPYGTKSEEEIRSLTLGHARRLYDMGIKALVVACNTATSAAIRPLREIYTDIPVIGIEPALKPAVRSGEHPRVLVMATPLTVQGSKFHRLLDQYRDWGEITALPCPGLMEYVEKGELSGPGVRSCLEKLLKPCLERGVDAIVLGCTHYPFVRPLIREIAGENVQILDGGEGTAREMRRRIDVAGLLTDKTTRGEVIFENSSDDKSKIELCNRLLNMYQ